MTDDNKFFVRPKVGFNQNVDGKDNEPQIENSVSAVATKSRGPKIKSIVSLKRPVRIVKSGNLQLSKRCVKADVELQNRNNSDSCSFDKTQALLSNSECFQIGVQKSLGNTTNINTTAVIQEQLDKNKSSDVPPHKPFHKTNELENKLKTPLTKNHAKNIQQLEKENQEANIQKKSTHKQELRKESNKSESAKNTVHTKYHCTPKMTKDNKSKTFLVKSRTEDGKVKSSGPFLSTVSNVMPCLKYTRANTKSTNISVKKTILRDVVGHNVKPYVGPGVPRGLNSQFGMSVYTENDLHFESGGISLRQFSKPEYNSIKCTIEHLNKVKKEKIVTDKEHLPSAYRDLMNRKITTALDFLPDEAIYKNLVDLSIDEKQLPARLIRSKDPEPRQRDIVPELSDFFNPEPTEEYCTAVLAKPRTSETQESWSAFRISDKISEWKHKIDHGG